MHEVVTSIKTWVQRQNYTKNFVKNHLELSGQGLKTLAYLVLLIYWGIIILGSFLQ
jgi:hypothetical protein